MIVGLEKIYQKINAKNVVAYDFEPEMDVVEAVA